MIISYFFEGNPEKKTFNKNEERKNIEFFIRFPINFSILKAKNRSINCFFFADYCETMFWPKYSSFWGV